MLRKSFQYTLMGIGFFAIASSAFAEQLPVCAAAYVPAVPLPSGIYIGLDGDLTKLGQYITGGDTNAEHIAWTEYQGYKINSTWAAELGYNAYPEDETNASAGGKLSTHMYGIYAAARWSHSFNNGFDIFWKFGPVLQNRTVNDDLGNNRDFQTVVLLGAGGIDYNITPHLQAVLQLTATNSKNDGTNHDLDMPSTFRFNAGLSYLF